MQTKLLRNYHTHTKRCKHATGEDREYVLAAIETGMQVLGFSDHVPWPGEIPGIERSRMALSELEGYFASLTALKSEFRNEIEIHIGFEVENLDRIDELLRLLEPYPCEYMLLGHHYSGYTREDHYFGRPFTEPELLELYTRKVVEGIASGRFLYVAHPDLPNFRGDPEALAASTDAICLAAKAADVPLEVNGLGFKGGRNYPREGFFHRAAELGCTLCVGLDAHSPAELADTENAEKVLAYAEQFGAPIRTEFRL